MDSSRNLVTEQSNPRTHNIDTLSTEEILRQINEEDKGVPEAVEKVIPEITRAVEIVTKRLRNGGRLFYVGAGTSGRLGVLDAAECPPTFRSDPEQVQGIIAGGADALVRSIEGAEDNEQDGADALDSHGVTSNDVVCGIATSGRTPFVIGALKHAGSQEIPTIAVICIPAEELEVKTDVVINPVVGPEVVTGSTRMKAGTATKLVLNMITTTTMIRLGKVYGNLMVDLTAVNNKLIDRAQRIVMEVTDVSRSEAARLLENAEYRVKNAILMALVGVGYEKSQILLEEAQGMLRDAIHSAMES
ncbi:MAG: N-acetylmuramic acid 6-phosphate etherase [Candidatus Marinimicrobia bacterium]|nr:N-acetylmuramic acid 6-phosphate etherase [Candidatus Neomarinimicrobiota bacterium]MCF7830090.1 N-acetylmuramic acid 6-phosphate etherase [Candidatus Neomarinimicrobiota bacterium]MCF7882137.1 N-acetylmuramic acid 6-phosphate etherase [Candidatus Neomarinimicrobiota bacterium]